MNACYGGRVGVGLTQLGGWAQKFLDSGASAFIGSLWEINDVLAARFAAEFYNRLLGLGGQRTAAAGRGVPRGAAGAEGTRPRQPDLAGLRAVRQPPRAGKSVNAPNRRWSFPRYTVAGDIVLLRLAGGKP